MENGDILDGQITASSELTSNHAAHRGRLHLKKSQGQFGAWTAANDDLHQWLQVDTTREQSDNNYLLPTILFQSFNVSKPFLENVLVYVRVFHY